MPGERFVRSQPHDDRIMIINNSRRSGVVAVG